MILGATQEQQYAVGALFEKAAAEIRREEIRLAKITQPAPSKIVVDFSEMREPVSRLVREIQDGLKKELPADTAETVTSSIEWGNFYQPGGETQLIFTIKTDNLGRPAADVTSENGYFGDSSFIHDPLPDNGSPVQAAALFGRWSHLLGERTIIPPKP